MRLADRLRAADPAAAATATPPPPPGAVPPQAPGAITPHTIAGVSAPDVAAPVQRGTGAAPVDALADLRNAVRTTLFSRLGAVLESADSDDTSLLKRVQDEAGAIVDEQRIPLSEDERARLVTDVVADALGHGPIEPLLRDESVTEIMVCSTRPVWVERNGQLVRTPVHFSSDVQLRQIIDRIVARVGRRIDESSPMVDARLPDGSRVNAIIPPLAVDGPSLTIRKFGHRALGMHDLLAYGTLSPQTADLLRACVQGRLNVLVSGGTGTGKTTLLNVLSSFIPDGERIVTVEDAVELQLAQEHVVRLESRPPNIEGKGEVSIRDLVRNALRMRPDRIIVGETRGGEALDMLQAMNTGHDGSLSTVHANAPRDSLSRLETMTLMAGFDLPLRAIREQIAAAIDVIVQIARLRDGTRRVTAITEIAGMQGEIITLQDIATFDWNAGIGPDGRYRGGLVATGIRPRFTDRLQHMGIDIPPAMLEPVPMEAWR